MTLKNCGYIILLQHTYNNNVSYNYYTIMFHITLKHWLLQKTQWLSERYILSDLSPIKIYFNYKQHSFNIYYLSNHMFVYLLQRFSYIPHTDTFFSVGSSEQSRIHGIKHDRVEGAFVLCQSFHSVVSTYIVNENSPVVAGAGEDFVIVRMNGQPIDRLFVQEDVEGFAPAKRRLLISADSVSTHSTHWLWKKCLTCANREL